MDWKLNYECHNRSGIVGGAGGSITYSADTPAEAVASALRWIKSREAMPDLFGNFVYFQISPHCIGPIDASGSLLTRTGMRIMEWSQDRAGVDMDTYCDWKIAEYSK